MLKYFVQIIGNKLRKKMCAKTCVMELQTYSLFFNKTINKETNLLKSWAKLCLARAFSSMFLPWCTICLLCFMNLEVFAIAKQWPPNMVLTWNLFWTNLLVPNSSYLVCHHQNSINGECNLLGQHHIHFCHQYSIHKLKYHHNLTWILLVLHIEYL